MNLSRAESSRSPLRMSGSPIPVLLLMLALVAPLTCRAAPALLLVSDQGGKRVLKYSAHTGQYLGTVVDSSQGLALPKAMILHPIRQTLLVTDATANCVKEFDLTTGRHLGAYTNSALRYPVALGVHPTRNTLLISGRDSRAILEFDLSTRDFIRVFASSPSNSIQYAFGFDFDLDRGTLLLANWEPNAGSIEEFDLLSGAYIRTLTHDIVEPTDVLINPHTRRVLADTNHSVLQFDSYTGTLLGSFASHPDLDYPSELAWDNFIDALLVVSKGDQQNVYRFNGMTGAFVDVFVQAGSGGLAGPGAVLVAIDPPEIRLGTESPGWVQLSWESVAGAVYQIQRSADIVFDQWSNVLQGVTGTGAVEHVSLSITNDCMQFYRLEAHY